MRSIEVTGENVEEAIAKGLEELGVGPNDIIYEVLEEPSRGVFGLGARLARVRVQVIRSHSAPPSSGPAAEESENLLSEEADDDMEDFSAAETSEDDATVGKEVLAELLEKMGIDASITVEQLEPSRPGEPAPWLLNVSGDDMSNLIGRRGETLGSLQYITRLIASRRLQRRANIVIDVAGYKSRRSQQLRKLASRMANQAVEQGRTVTLEPMPPHERRIIHMALRNRPDVLTKSIGEGDSRKVTIVPK